jgi:hypothetical protein
MHINNYSYLHSFDGFNVYLPYTQELLSVNSLPELITEIYQTSRYAFVGSILIPFVYIGKLSNYLGGNLYFSIQLVVIFFAALSTVVVYNILLLNNFKPKKAVEFTLYYIFLSMHFYKATLIVRDMPINLFLMCVIYLSMKKYSLKNILLMIILMACIMTLRLSSGIFASVYILLVLYVTSSKGSSYNKIKINLLFFLALITLIYNFKTIDEVFSEKMEIYAAIQLEDQDGASTIAAFDILPPGLSHFTKAAYNQIMPIPSWRTMIQSSYRPETYNVTNFPVILATFFRYVMWGIIIVGLFNKRIRKSLYENKILFYNFLIAILFLLIQSSTMGHRRMMAVYPVFFLVALLFYQKYNSQGQRNLILMSSVIFLLIQLVGFKYLN